MAHYNLGTALKAKGDVNGAIACFREAIRLDPTSLVVHTDLGKALQDLGKALRDKRDLERAIDAFREAVRLDPKSIAGHDELGRVLMRYGNYEMAMTYFLRPPHQNLWANSGSGRAPRR